MIPYNNSIIVPVDTGYGNIKNSLHSFPTGIAAYKTKPAFEGKILHMRSIGTNINQIAMVVNSEKSVFKGDIDSLRREVEKISEEFHSYISPLKSQEV